MTAPDAQALIMLRRLRVLATTSGNHEMYRALVDATSALLALPGQSGIGRPPPGPDHGFMTAREFATEVNLTPQAVQLGCRQGRISAVKRAGVWLIPRTELVRREGTR